MSASAQQRTFYDWPAARASAARPPSSQGIVVTNTDARGKVISREFTSGNVTTVYDESGRLLGQGILFESSVGETA